MSAAAGWLLRLICAAMLCSLINAMAGTGPGQGIRRLLCAVFLMVTALSPGELPDLSEFDTELFRRDAEVAVQDGLDQADAARSAIITESCETYILNKAAELGLQLQVRVTLDAQLKPASVTLTGRVSPAERERLSRCITRDLGLEKEAQTWIDPYQSSE